MDERAVLYWSGGKDCALALHQLHASPRFKGIRVSTLLTTFTDGYARVSGHGIREALIERQADSLGLELYKTYIPQRASMDQYESVMEEALARYRSQGVGVAVSGDIYIEKQRISIFKRMGFKGCFPLWEKSTQEQIRVFLASGIKAYVVCVDSAVLDRSFVGQALDADFLARLPAHVDPCGENGEFHTFVFDGPMFRYPIRCRFGEVVFRESLYFSDLIPE